MGTFLVKTIQYTVKFPEDCPLDATKGCQVIIVIQRPSARYGTGVYPTANSLVFCVPMVPFSTNLLESVIGGLTSIAPRRPIYTTSTKISTEYPSTIATIYSRKKRRISEIFKYKTDSTVISFSSSKAGGVLNESKSVDYYHVASL